MPGSSWPTAEADAGAWPCSTARLGLAALTKDALGALGPLLVVALFLWLTRERPYRAWVPWWGVLLLLAVALPWYVAVELRNSGFLWYTVVDNHLLNFTRQRVFPDEDVPLSALEFLAVNVLAFLPWTLALPWGVARAFKRPWADAEARLWMLFALWALLLLGFFTLSPFKLPHYGLPAFPALALLAARAWDDSIEAIPGAAAPRVLMVPICILFAVLAVAFALAAAGRLPLHDAALVKVDVAARNLAARGEAIPQGPLEPYVSILVKCVVVFAIATVGMAIAAARRWPAVGVGVALAAMIAFLPMAGEGMTQFARSRSVRPLAEALAQRRAPGDRVVHEGSLREQCLAAAAGPRARCPWCTGGSPISPSARRSRRPARSSGTRPDCKRRGRDRSAAFSSRRWRRRAASSRRLHRCISSRRLADDGSTATGRNDVGRTARRRGPDARRPGARCARCRAPGDHRGPDRHGWVVGPPSGCGSIGPRSRWWRRWRWPPFATSSARTPSARGCRGAGCSAAWSPTPC